MVGVSREEVVNTPEIDSQAVKEEPVVEASPALLKIDQPTEEEVLEERTENEDTPRANRDNEDTIKYGFGAGMRMYAKSLAMAEQQEKSVTPEMSPTKVVSPKQEKPVTPKVEEPKVESQTEESVPEEETAKAEEAAPAAEAAPACGNIFQQIQDAIGEFFRKTEEVVDDAHERVCSRSPPCNSTDQNADLATLEETPEEADEIAESSVEEPKTEEVEEA